MGTMRRSLQELGESTWNLEEDMEDVWSYEAKMEQQLLQVYSYRCPR